MHVPGWHEATKKLQQEGKFQMVGIIEEQHPDRARRGADLSDIAIEGAVKS